jgi:hypothetical protein
MELEFEALYNILKTIINNRTTFNEFNEYKDIFNQYINIINDILLHNQLSKRSIFFLNDIISNFNCIILNKKIERGDKKEKDMKSTFLEKIKNNQMSELMYIYNNLDKDTKYNIIYKIVESFLDDKKINKNIIQFLYMINDAILFYNIIDNIIININDIILDIPNVNEKLLYLINNINYEHKNKDNIINILKNIDIDSDEELNEKSDKEDSKEDSEEDSDEESI